VGCVMTAVIAFFIIVACAGAILLSAAELQTPTKPPSVEALRQYAFLLFSAGCLTLRFSRLHSGRFPPRIPSARALGLNRASTSAWRGAHFLALYALLIVVGAGVF